jgi:hypothetical protein
MAIWNKNTQQFNSDNFVQFESVVLSGPAGTAITESNPLPVNISALGNVDAFGRNRMSEPYTLGDYKHVYGLDPNFLDFSVNGGSSTFQSNKACARLATTSNSSSRLVHQTKMYHHYMPGKSQLIMSSFCFYAATPNVLKRTGYYDDSNGIFFEQGANGVLAMVVRSSVTGSPEEERITQSNWNTDKCNGTGPSGFNIDITKTQLWWCDFQWLGVGRVRVGFVHDGKLIICHNFYHSNHISTVYLSNPNLPVRCEIANVGTTSGAFMDQICSTVISEGGYVESGIDYSFQSPTLRSLAAGATLPVLAIRLKNTFNTYANRLTVRAGNLSVFTTASSVSWKLVKLSGVSAMNTGAWSDVNTGVSGVEYNVTATGTPTGEVIDGGFIAANTQSGNRNSSGSLTPNLPSASKKNFITQNYGSTDSEIYVVVVKNIGADTTTVGASMQWREIL